jgi:hypothetical protein
MEIDIRVHMNTCQLK